MLKITLKDKSIDMKVSVETASGTNCYDVLTNFKDMLITFGYHVNTVKDAIMEMADQFNLEENETGNPLLDDSEFPEEPKEGCDEISDSDSSKTDDFIEHVKKYDDDQLLVPF